ncbi:class I SAM-dependent methyltransferase [Paraferrimonas haliotis]|nr:class I SAM-dependent methyltransferase [Paraferrimonas haliotis]
MENDQRQRLCNQFSLEHDGSSAFTLAYDNKALGLTHSLRPKMTPVLVDFVGGAQAHRRKFGGGRGQAIAKAVGLKKGATPSVIDGTAGLGRDSFVLASLGCFVTMVERHPVVAALLSDGLMRAIEDPEIGVWVEQRLRLVVQSTTDFLLSQPSADVVYLDPMYPHRAKSAQVKKEMAIFQDLVGADTDADLLLASAKAVAAKRVVVKRPDYAEPMANCPPSTQILTKKNRFDLYVRN